MTIVALLVASIIVILLMLSAAFPSSLSEYKNKEKQAQEAVDSFNNRLQLDEKQREDLIKSQQD